MSAIAPPHSVEAERAIIGALVVDPSVIHTIDLDSRDFYVAGNRAIFSAIRQLEAKNIEPDLITISNHIKGTGHLDEIGGMTYIAELCLDEAFTAANAKHYASIIVEHAKSRRLISAARQIAKLATAEDIDPSQRSAMAYSILEEATSDHEATSDLLTIDQLATIFKQHVDKLGNSRFVTGWPELDSVIRGVAPGEVMMITAYSGLFKSALLQNMLLNSAQSTGAHNLFFSIEMPAARVFQRTCQIALERYTHDIESGFHNRKGYLEETVTELHRVAADKLIVCPRPAVTIEQVEHITRQAKARYGTIGAIGIDYLGLMSAEGKEREYDRISHVAENSKPLAKRLDVPVIILTHIDRTSAREGKVEKFSAKGSGAIEASADYMVGLEKDENKQLVLKLLKNRNGEENLAFDVDIEARYLKVRSVTARDMIASKIVKNCSSRLSQKHSHGAQGYGPQFP